MFAQARTAPTIPASIPRHRRRTRNRRGKPSPSCIPVAPAYKQHGYAFKKPGARNRARLFFRPLHPSRTCIETGGHYIPISKEPTQMGEFPKSIGSCAHPLWKMPREIRHISGTQQRTSHYSKRIIIDLKTACYEQLFRLLSITRNAWHSDCNIKVRKRLRKWKLSQEPRNPSRLGLASSMLVGQWQEVVLDQVIKSK